MSQKQNPLKVLAEDIQAIEARQQAQTEAKVQTTKAQAQAPKGKGKQQPQRDANTNGNGKRPVTFPCGKYEGKTVAEVLALGKEGRSYLEWFVEMAEKKEGRSCLDRFVEMAEMVESKGKVIQTLQAQAREALATTA